MRRYLVLLCFAATQARAVPTLESWIAANADPAEAILCRKEANGEYFFIARAGDSDRLRLGSRVDLSAYRPPNFSISIAWRLRNEDDRSLATNIKPTVLKQDYLPVAGEAHAESVHYQTVNIGWSKRLRVSVAIEKCAEHPCTEKSVSTMRYTVHICDAPL